MRVTDVLPRRYFPELRLAVAKSNKYDENYTYTCPPTYHWANGSDIEALIAVGETVILMTLPPHHY